MCGHDPSLLTPAQPHLLRRFGTVDRVAAVGHAGHAPEFEPRRASGQRVDSTVGESKPKSELEAKDKKQKANKKQKRKDAKDAKCKDAKDKAAAKKRERDATSPVEASADQYEIWLQGKLMTDCDELIVAASELTIHVKHGRQAREHSLRAAVEALFYSPENIGRITLKNCRAADRWEDSDGYVVYPLVPFIVGHCCG